MSKSVSQFQYLNSSPEIIRLVVMMYIRFPLSLRNVEDLVFERGIDISHGTVRFWWNRFGPLFASAIRRLRVSRMRRLLWTPYPRSLGATEVSQFDEGHRQMRRNVSTSILLRALVMARRAESLAAGVALIAAGSGLWAVGAGMVPRLP